MPKHRKRIYTAEQIQSKVEQAKKRFDQMTDEEYKEYRKRRNAQAKKRNAKLTKEERKEKKTASLKSKSPEELLEMKKAAVIRSREAVKKRLKKMTKKELAEFKANERDKSQRNKNKLETVLKKDGITIYVKEIHGEFVATETILRKTLHSRRNKAKKKGIKLVDARRRGAAEIEQQRKVTPIKRRKPPRKPTCTIADQEQEQDEQQSVTKIRKSSRLASKRKQKQNPKQTSVKKRKIQDEEDLGLDVAEEETHLETEKLEKARNLLQKHRALKKPRIAVDIGAEVAEEEEDEITTSQSRDHSDFESETHEVIEVISESDEEAAMAELLYEDFVEILDGIEDEKEKKLEEEMDKEERMTAAHYGRDYSVTTSIPYYLDDESIRSYFGSEDDSDMPTAILLEDPIPAIPESPPIPKTIVTSRFGLYAHQPSVNHSTPATNLLQQDDNDPDDVRARMRISNLLD